MTADRLHKLLEEKINMYLERGPMTHDSHGTHFIAIVLLTVGLRIARVLEDKNTMVGKL